MKKIGRLARVTAAKRATKHQITPTKTQSFLNVVQTSGTPHGLDVKEFCDSYALNQDTFTRLSGFSPRAVAHWSRGRKPSVSTARRLIELTRLFMSLADLIASEKIGPWLKEPNPAFDGSTPLQVLERGEADRIWRMIYELESGEPG